MSSPTQEPARVVAFDARNGPRDMPEERRMPRDLRVALLEDILSLREHRIAHLERRIESLEDDLASKDERLDAQERERRQMIENYERILSQRNENVSTESNNGPVAALHHLVDSTLGY